MLHVQEYRHVQELSCTCRLNNILLKTFINNVQNAWIGVPRYCHWLQEVKSDKCSAMCTYCNEEFQSGRVLALGYASECFLSVQ
ncbi:hypothetical protein CEXT_787751 [Caerostris extrusa]|uniref:Uncharacterized protein n=1 Tax=Caerostris extrusa TaxID=172846 RepID=A0AAV4MNA0_CAEEX|nr:hypothetical protein CEXT_787751 [Caerostris extrusa]